MNIQKSLISILALNIKGQLGRMTGCFSKNGLNILRLVLSAADLDDRIHKTIAYVESTNEELLKAINELGQLEGVLKVKYYQQNSEFIEKELCLVKILSSDPALIWVSSAINELNGKVISTKNGVSIYQIEGTDLEITDFINQLLEFTKSVELCRSGMVATSLTKDLIDYNELQSLLN